MAILEVEINGKIYQIGCEPNDEEKIKEYVAVLNKRIEKFKKQDPLFFMGLNDERIFLFEAITLVSEIMEKNSLENPHKNEVIESNQESLMDVTLGSRIDVASAKVAKISGLVKRIQNIIKI